MTCEELSDDYGTYALGALDGPALDELRSHLARQCENCTPGVRDARSLLSRMTLTVPPVDPPKRLRARVMSLVQPESRSSRWVWILASTTALFAFFTGHIWMRHQESHQEFIAFEQRFNNLRTENAR